MSKHQSCSTCGSDFVGPDMNIGSNLCYDCDEHSHGEYQAEIERLQRELRIKVQIVDEQHDAMSDKDGEIKRLRLELASVNCDQRASVFEEVVW